MSLLIVIRLLNDVASAKIVLVMKNSRIVLAIKQQKDHFPLPFILLVAGLRLRAGDDG